MTMDTIRRLREKTGAGMMDCKRALTEAQGDFDKAVEVLRKKGLADAAKRSARATKEGLIACHLSPDETRGAIVELNCETDFVAKTDEFKALAGRLAEAASEAAFTAGSAAAIIEPVQVQLKENMALRRFERFESPSGRLAQYVHTAGYKRGAMVELSLGEGAARSHEAVSALGRELAMQVTAMGPKWVARKDVPASEVEKEKEIYSEIVRKEGKPEASLPKIVEGKLNKLFFGSFCLVEQMSMRDNKTPVSKLVADAAAKAGGPVEVRRFTRYQLGE
jgi:elongation factor Ts